MAVMTFVMTAILVACSVNDDTNDLMDYNSYYYTNSINSGRFKLRWIADKKTIGNTWAMIVCDDENYKMEMGGWTLPVDYILTGKLEGEDLNDAVAYANTYPEIISVMLIRVGTTEANSYFYRILSYSSDNSIPFKISYQNTVKECKLYLDSNGSALTMDNEQNNLLGVLKVDSIEIYGEEETLMDRNGFSLTFSGERE
ncbi:MAG: hypothetical protein IKX33_08255 [Prevotella sp.]|nr:hypothetical protein [Prevotella sp.]